MKRKLSEQVQVACHWCIHEERCRLLVVECVPLPCTQELSNGEAVVMNRLSFDERVVLAYG